MKTGVLPMYDEDGNEIYAILTPYQQKEFNKMVARSQKILNASFKNAKLQDFEEPEVNQEVVLEDAKNEEEPEKTDDLEQGDDLGDDYEEYDEEKQKKLSKLNAQQRKVVSAYYGESIEEPDGAGDDVAADS